MNDTMKLVLPVFLTIAVPSLMVMAGILVNKSEITRLEAKMDKQHDKPKGKIDKLTELVHQGILNLTVRSGEHDTRLSLLEERLKS